MDKVVFCKRCKVPLKQEHRFCPNCGREVHPAPKNTPRRPKGSGCVSKLSGNRTKPFRAIKNGVCVGTFPTHEQASLCLLQYQSKRVTSLENITLGQIYEKWLKTDWYEGLSKSVKGNYTAAWKRLSMHQSEKMKALKTSHYQIVIDAVKAEGLERDTCEKVRTLISILCKYAMSDDIVDRNYAEGLRLPEKVGRKKRNFTDDEILTLFYNDHDRDARIVLCLLYTGMRENELFSMLKENVDLRMGYMLGGSKTDAGKNRIIPIRKEIFEYIQDFYEAGDSPYLISNAKGGKIDAKNFLRRNFYPLLDALKIQRKDETGKNVLTPHRTRHTFISENIKAGIKPEVLTKVVGHSNYATSIDKYNQYVDIEYIIRESKKGM